MKIFESMSRLVFGLLALTACVGFFMGILEAKDFMVLAGSAFGYYFGRAKTTADVATVDEFLGD